MAIKSKPEEDSRPRPRWPHTFRRTLSHPCTRVSTSTPCRCREGAKKTSVSHGGKWHRVIAFALLVALAACAGPEPLLRSNKHLQLYGKQMGQQDIDACQRKAEEAGLHSGVHRSGNVAAGAVLGLAVGGAVGASAG